MNPNEDRSVSSTQNVVSARKRRGSLAALIASLMCLPLAAPAQTDDPDDEKEAVDEIVVVGSQVSLTRAFAGGQVARGGRVGLLGNLDYMDTPFSSTNFTAELITDQQARGVGDVLQNDPVVRVARGFGNFQELYVIRGLPVFSDDMLYNGVYGILPRQFVAAELLDRVEVFRGANAFLNGAAPGGSALGGAVNLVPKRAPADPLNKVTLGFENQGHGYLAADFGRRFGPGQDTGMRINLVRRDGETAIDEQDRELTVASLGIDYDGERLRLAADLGFQDHHIDSPRPSVTPFGGIPRPPKAKSNFAQPWTFSDEQQIFGVVRAEYDLTDKVSVWGATGLRDGEEENRLANPNSDADGNTSAFRFDNFREDRIYSSDAGVASEFSTGAVDHRFVVSGAIFSMKARNAFALSDFSGFQSNLYDPTPVAPPPADFFVGGSMDDPHVTLKTDTWSVGVVDMLSFLDDRVLLILGARLQNIKTQSFNFDTGERESVYDEQRTTPMAGLVVRVGEQYSVYGNYIEGLIPGDVAPAVSGGEPVENAGEVFKPYQAEQFEVGVKYDGGNFGGTLSAFTLDRPSAFVADNVFRVAGKQRNRGIELSTFGAPREDLRVLGGLTWIDAEQVRTADGVNDGNDVIGVPDFQLNVNLEWDTPWAQGLTLDGRAVHTSSQYADAANTLKVSSWRRFDLGARHSTRLGANDWDFRARIDNVTDRNDWVSVGGFPGANYMVLGGPRTFVVSASVYF